MTFTEANVNRDKGGKFDHKTGSAPSIELSTESDEEFADRLADKQDRLSSFLADITENEITAGRAVAKAFAPRSTLTPVKVFDSNAPEAYSIGLMEESGAIYYTYEPDADGVPINLSILGKREPYSTSAYRHAEDEAWEALGIPIPSEAERHARHVEHDVKEFQNSVLRPTRRMNGNPDAGDWHYETHDIRLGTGPDKERLYGSFRIERVTTDGEPRYDVAYTGAVNSSTGRMESMGQTLDHFENAEPYAKGKRSSDVDPVRFYELWDKNHLTRDATADDIYESLEILRKAQKFQG